MLPELVHVTDIPAGGTGACGESGSVIPIGVDEEGLARVAVDLSVDPHLVCFADAESGKTTFLRVLARGLVRGCRPDEVRIVVVDYRRGLLGAVPPSHLLAHASTADAAEQAARDIAASLRGRLPGVDVGPRELRDRSWWSGPEVVVLVDDYDLVAPAGGAAVNPLLPLVEFLPQAKDVGLHLVVARRCGGAGRALFDPLLGRLRELAAPGLVMNGNPDEGALVGTVKPQALPPGRALLVDRRRGTQRVQLALDAAGRRLLGPGRRPAAVDAIPARRPVSRVAVHVGTAWVRVAVEDPRPRLLAALPVCDADPLGLLRTGLPALLDRPADQLLVVHASGAPAMVPPTVPPTVAAAVRPVPAAVAALGSAPAQLDAVVVDVGHAGTEIARVAGGRVVVSCRVPVGGAVLDDATAELLGGAAGMWGAYRAGSRAEIRAVRERLSLQPVARAGVPPVELHADALRRALAPHLAAVVGGVRTVRDGAGPGRSPPVLLIGGVARMPLLAELLDAAGVPDVRVAARPDSAAVVGALRLPPDLLGPPPAAHPVGSAPRPASWLPPVTRQRHRPVRALAAAAAAVVGLSGLYAAGSTLPAPGPVPLAAAGELVQYGYAVRLPAGWAHTGGLPERRRSLLTPVGAPDGGDLISVERTPLGYDADAEPQRARAELRAEFARAAADGAPLAGFDDDARFAGRRVVGYREAAGPDAAQVDWYVVLDGEAQLSVGCRHTTAGASAVAAACATVVGSLRRTT